MSAERTTRVVVGPDGKPRKRLRNGRTVALKGRTNWKRLAEMTEAEVAARARADRDARPVPRKRLGEFRRVSLSPNEVRSIRRRSGLSQAAFAARYGLNLRTLRDVRGVGPVHQKPSEQTRERGRDGVPTTRVVRVHIGGV